MMQKIKIDEIRGFSPENLSEYASSFSNIYQDPGSTEETFYKAFHSLLECFFDKKYGFSVKTVRIQEGTTSKPDFTVLLNNFPILLIEAKKPQSNLVEWLKSEKDNRLKEQIIHYRKDYGLKIPIIITNFIELHLLKIPPEEKYSHVVEISRSAQILEKKGNDWIFNINVKPQFENILQNSINNIVISIEDIKGMIVILAKQARELRDSIYHAFFNPKEKMTIYLQTIKEDLEKTIFSSLKEDSNFLFSDLVAQTIVYGAFCAWLKFCSENNDPKSFKIESVGKYLPYGSFIRQLFLDTTGRVSPIIEQNYISQIELIFQSTKFEKIFNKPDNIMTMFYSIFLHEYDEETAKKRGVIYTPSEIVDFMIRGIDYFLEFKFHKSDGIINSDSAFKDKSSNTKNKYLDTNSNSEQMIVNFLEPASGTMAFPCGLLKYAKEKFDKLYQNQPGLAINYFVQWLENIFFKNMYAFEILMAPYVLGFIRTQMTIKDILSEAKSPGMLAKFDIEAIHNKLQSHLMNTLMNPENIDQYLIKDDNIRNEITEGLSVRDFKQIYIVFGNPPYNVSTQNESIWINSLIKDYKTGLNEKNLKILSDDYVKFIRFAQWKIEQSKLGMVVYITNNNYLDGSVFKVMRRSLMETFNEIYIVNLHGNMRKNETGNPFNIKVGVSIIFLLRTDEQYGKDRLIIPKDKDKHTLKTLTTSTLDDYVGINDSTVEINKNIIEKFQTIDFGCKIKYWDIPQPTVDLKYWELSKPFSESNFFNLNISPDFYFVPKDLDQELNYFKFISIEDLFKEKPKSGIMAGRDAFVSNVDKDLLIENIRLFFDKKFDKLAHYNINLSETKTWKKEEAFSKSNIEKANKSIIKYNYRGLDTRYLIYDNAFVEGCRSGYLDLINEDNPAISVTRSIRADHFSHVLITKYPPEKCFLAVKDSSYVFLLKANKKQEYNLNIPKIGFKIEPEDLFYYIYGILFSPNYRKRYESQLKSHFPRIPFPNTPDKFRNETLFKQMSALGKKLADIHLNRSDLIDISKFSTNNCSDFRIINPIYDKSTQRIYFNKPNNHEEGSILWIGNISKDIWDFEIGSIQQIENWLEDRKYLDPQIEDNKKEKRHKKLRRALYPQEFTELLRLCSIIKNTIDLLPELDKIYNLIDFN